MSGFCSPVIDLQREVRGQSYAAPHTALREIVSRIYYGNMPCFESLHLF